MLPKLWLAAIWIPALPALLSAVDFNSPKAFGAGSFVSVAVADFSGDGNPDLAGVSTDNHVAILLGDGNGSFRPAVYYAAGEMPIMVKVADFNGDGKPDLAVANEKSHSISILLGNGDGTFQPQIVTTGIKPSAMVVGDFDGDGNVDLALTGQFSISTSVVCVFLGNGDGTFRQQVTRGLKKPNGLVMADFNGDGKPDLAVLDLDGTEILLGNGDGTFQPAVNYPYQTNSTSIAAADLNGDGKPDLSVPRPATASLRAGQ
jgi:hypothetical protein